MSTGYSNPNDPYRESIIVKYGASMSGEDFHASNHYFYHLGLISGIVCLFGLVSILFLILGLYLRTHYEVFKLRPRPPEEEVSSYAEGSRADQRSAQDGEDQHHHLHQDHVEGEEDPENPNMVVDILERVQLEEHFGSLPQAVAESIATDEDDLDKEKEKEKYYENEEDRIYEEKLQQKISEHGVEHRYDPDDPDKKLKDDDEEWNEADDAHYFGPGAAHPAAVMPGAVGYYPQPYGHVYPPPVPPHYSYPQHLPSPPEDLHYVNDPEQAPPTRHELEEGSFHHPRSHASRSKRSRGAKSGSNVSREESTLEAYPWNKERVNNAILLYSLCLCFLVFVQFYIIGASYSQSGLTHVLHNIDSVKTSITAVVSFANALINDGSSLQTSMQNAESTCHYFAHPYFTGIEASVAIYRATALQMAQGFAPLYKDLDNVQSYQKYFAQGAPLYVLWALGMLFLVLVVFFTYKEHRLGLKITVAYGISLLFVYVLCGALLLSLTMMFGDFCTDPSYNVVTNLPSTDNIQDLANYYSTCNPAYKTFFQSDMSIIGTQLNYLYNRTVWATTSSNVCPGDSNLNAMTGLVVNANNTLTLLEQTGSCAGLQSVWYEIFNKGTCDVFYSGVFYAWGGQLLTSLFLFAILITASITYQFYPNYSKLHNEESTRDSSEQQGSLDESRHEEKRSEVDEQEQQGEGSVARSGRSNPIYAGQYQYPPQRRQSPPGRQPSGGGRRAEDSGFVFQAESHGDDDEEIDQGRVRSMHHYYPEVEHVNV